MGMSIRVLVGDVISRVVFYSSRVCAVLSLATTLELSWRCRRSEALNSCRGKI